jgi:hypothetical protein
MGKRRLPPLWWARFLWWLPTWEPFGWRLGWRMWRRFPREHRMMCAAKSAIHRRVS